ncbi:NHL domain-containing thioredoxin family protein [Ruania halotolerans]|uniref:NHL domain-containing thioredoxin family protein n=1 Tax=Ruania halotolerans TaxID=2897773 RepID=UPI001E555502|nr:NHL domain-containing thioredoxin family protein [Ruania halotolerans]UFU06240.1 NHL domain-containing thioredoxin family protein [Ruania halotolerans]
MTESESRLPRVRASELAGRGWLNTGGAELTLADLRGKVVILDFWTFCCINCLHVLDELRELEERFREELVIVGVHSPKFAHEADPAALAAAVERYGVAHPVLDDAEMTTWTAYTARAWPTLVVIDPDGYVVAQVAGEGHAPALGRLLDELIAEHEARGTLHRGEGPYVPPDPPSTLLRFPAKALRLPNGNLLVADAGHHSLAELTPDGEMLVRRIGSGERGAQDGVLNGASFNEPNGLCLLPPELRERLGYDVVVADTVNHLIRGVRLSDGAVHTVAGTGRPYRVGAPDNVDPDHRLPDRLRQNLSSPWDVAWVPRLGAVLVAMAGTHTLWALDDEQDRLEPIGGTMHEGLVDGELSQAWFAQPSGLAAGADGQVWLADAETSALRLAQFTGGFSGEVSTAVGEGLFEFGHRDGPAGTALLQHPLDVCVLGDGSIAVADTYNGAVRRYDPLTREVTTLASDLAEPSGLLLADGHLLVVESAAHRLTRVPLGAAVAHDGDAHRMQRPVTEVGAQVELRVLFTPAPGTTLDERYGPATQVSVAATPPSLLAWGHGQDTDLSRELHLTEGEGVLHVSARAAACDGDPSVEFPACHLAQQDWGIPVRVVPGGASELELPLFG